jgi:hypothetical protein
VLTHCGIRNKVPCASIVPNTIWDEGKGRGEFYTPSQAKTFTLRPKFQLGTEITCRNSVSENPQASAASAKDLIFLLQYTGGIYNIR